MFEKKGPIQKQRHCTFCVKGDHDIDYKDVHVLSRYLSSFGRIVPRKRSGVCDWHQRRLSNAIKLARTMALVPFLQQ